MATYSPKTLLAQESLISKGYNLGKDGADGYWGPKTETAYQLWLQEYGKSPLSAKWPVESYKALNAFFGTPNFADGIAPNIGTLYLPYPMKLSWDKDHVIHSISCNQKIIGSLGIILNEINLEYKEEGIKEYDLDLFGGCINVRKKQGNPSEWSTHSWGIAIDIDTIGNAYHLPWEDGKQGQEGYATMPTKVIEIFESEGWKSGARAWGLDAQHFQCTQ